MIDSLPIAVRAFPVPEGVDENPRSHKHSHTPESMFVFDTETRIDATQRLTFGSYQFHAGGECLEEGLFYADDLTRTEMKIIKQYFEHHRREMKLKGIRWCLLTREEFLDRLYKATYKGRCLLVGFNLPFDLSRVAYDVATARGRFAGGFSLGLWSYIDQNGQVRPNQFRPRVGIKQIDSKRALKGFTARNSPDSTDLIPEDSKTGKPQEGYKFRGHFLDLRTLAFALTDRGYTLEGACVAFDVAHGKQSASVHGTVTEEYIDYNRRDVLATAELAVKLLEEYRKHPISLQVTKAYSPASIGKAYLREIGVLPILQRQLTFPREYLGYAQSAFFGGRTSAHIRKVPVPVVYTDFLSMYPTVNGLMGLWRFVIAREITVVEHCQVEIEELLRRLTPNDLFKPDTWKNLTAFVKIIPGGDILPSRSKYNAESNDWQVAVNHLYSQGTDPGDGMWFSLPDIAASVIVTGRTPRIIDAFRIEPRETVKGLKPIKLRGAIEVDPKTEDFFKVVIEQRKALSRRKDIAKSEQDRMDKALKVLANSTSYGIYAEMNRQESEEKVNVKCFGIDEEPFECRVSHPDVPGEYCFPPLASLITGAARLMLALLEHSVTELGGTYAMEDTDSMAIVATQRGGLVLCPGGSYRKGKRQAVKALSWEQVRAIADRFAALNPYDHSIVNGSVLKLEDDNFSPHTRKQRQIYCLAISAKRYALFVLDKNGIPTLLTKDLNNKEDRWSEHGLGHLLNPTDPTSNDRDWIAQAWVNIVRRSLGLSTSPLDFQNMPAVGRVTVGSPAVMRPLQNVNSGKAYADQIKPFNFLLTCHVKQLGHPVGVDPEHFHLVAPYESDSRRWLKHDWIDQYTGNTYRIATTTRHDIRQTTLVKTYGDVLLEYEFHSESKCADSSGNNCSKATVGLLKRRHIRCDLIQYIGKESNSLEDVNAGAVHAAGDVYTEYVDKRRTEWQMKVVPLLRTLPLSLLVRESGLSRRMLIDARAGRSTPHARNQALLKLISDGLV